MYPTFPRRTLHRLQTLWRHSDFSPRRKLTSKSLSKRQELQNHFTCCNSEAGRMDIGLLALVLSILLGIFVVIPRFRKSGNAEGKHAHSDAKGKASKAYSKAEISLHNKRSDCWIIVKDKVYDVTLYVEEHPGGDAILAHAGDDSTEGFFGPQHATRVFDMIDDFYIGDLHK